MNGVYKNLQAFFSLKQVSAIKTFFRLCVALLLYAYFRIFLNSHNDCWNVCLCFVSKTLKKTKTQELIWDGVCMYVGMKFLNFSFLFISLSHKNFKFISNFSHNHGHCFYHFTPENWRHSHKKQQQQQHRINHRGFSHRFKQESCNSIDWVWSLCVWACKFADWFHSDLTIFRCVILSSSSFSYRLHCARSLC